MIDECHVLFPSKGDVGNYNYCRALVKVLGKKIEFFWSKELLQVEHRRKILSAHW